LQLTFTAWRQRVRFHNALEAIARASRSNGSRPATALPFTPSAFSAAFSGRDGSPTCARRDDGLKKRRSWSQCPRRIGGNDSIGVGFPAASAGTICIRMNGLPRSRPATCRLRRDGRRAWRSPL
jgi:hypothetical protein